MKAASISLLPAGSQSALELFWGAWGRRTATFRVCPSSVVHRAAAERAAELLSPPRSGAAGGKDTSLSAGEGTCVDCIQHSWTVKVTAIRHLPRTERSFQQLSTVLPVPSTQLTSRSAYLSFSQSCTDTREGLAGSSAPRHREGEQFAQGHAERLGQKRPILTPGLRCGEQEGGKGERERSRKAAAAGTCRRGAPGGQEEVSEAG